jgi:Ser/Thr protein kinase RdoA (MazF antagonist)
MRGISGQALTTLATVSVLLAGRVALRRENLETVQTLGLFSGSLQQMLDKKIKDRNNLLRLTYLGAFSTAKAEAALAKKSEADLSPTSLIKSGFSRRFGP